MYYYCIKLQISATLYCWKQHSISGENYTTNEERKHVLFFSIVIVPTTIFC